ncbi:hypothetical protein PHET_02706 [Paragonimus heterotremus]|uniref:Uncharacterized protein n=1 Tax=Paragonimus heterotremus TaxID=100268 RepID=A0A8J4TFC1_9TREM|nr:hypothetical protein PHET_02706 [Paragonimus heterotremus]
MHLYVTKSCDDFTAYRDDGCVIDVQLPSVHKGYHFSSTFSRTGTTVGSAGYSEPVSPNEPNKPPLVNTATQSCLAAMEATSLGLSAAFSLAARLNAPRPLDEISGFESGYHMDKESNVIVLIGCASVHVIALSDTDEMFRWADVMSQIMNDQRFRVTLCKSTDGKLSQGTQGSLHVQHLRLCLIGEPSAGCKFICSWRLDAIDHAYTMPLSTNNASVPIGDTQSTVTRKSHGVDVSNRSSRGNLSNSNSVTTASHKTPQKNLFILEANQSAGKGRGSHTFELDGRSLEELTTVIERLMAQRYNPELRSTRKWTDSQPQGAGHSSTGSVPIAPGPCARNYEVVVSSSCPRAQQLESSPDVCSSRHSMSPAQNVPSRSHPTGLCVSTSSPFTTPESCLVVRTEDSSCALSNHQMIYGRSVPALPTNRHYSNFFPSACSLSPPDLLSGLSKPSECRSSSRRNPDERGTELLNNSHTVDNTSGYNTDVHATDLTVARPDVRVAANCATLPAFTSSTYANIVSTPSCFPNARRSLGFRPPEDYSYSFRSPVMPTYDEMDNVLHSSLEETQVVRVPAGLIIAKRPLPTSMFSANTTSKQFPLPTPVLSNRSLLKSRQEPVVSLTTTTTSTDPQTSPNPHRPYRYPKRFSKVCRPHFSPRTKAAVAVPNSVPSEPNSINTVQQLRQDNAALPSNGFTQQGVFIADEDLWDAEQIAPSKSAILEPEVRPASVGVFKCNLDTVLSVQPNSNPSRKMYRQEPCHTCSSCSKKEKKLALCANYHRIYRHRCRQYRVCFCPSYVGRSLSFDALFLLEIPRATDAAPFTGSITQVSNAVDCASHLAFHGHPNSTGPLDHSTAHPLPIVSSDLSPIYSVELDAPKSSTVNRWKQIHRIFHRKHSKSHDNLHSSCQISEKPAPDSKPVISTSATEEVMEPTDLHQKHTFRVEAHDGSQLLTDQNYAIVVPRELSSLTNQGQQLLQLFIRCPRHGSLSYHTWFEFFHGDLPLHSLFCSRCRKRSKRHLPLNVCVKNPRACDDFSHVAGQASSLFSTLRNLVPSRRKSQGSRFSFGKIVTKRKTTGISRPVQAQITAGCELISESRAVRPAGVSRSFNAVLYRDVIDSTHSTNKTGQNQITRCEHISQRTHPLDRERHSCSILSLTSLSCSEPSISRTADLMFGRLLALNAVNRSSLHSSLSSLPTFHSLSGSSSLLSASHGDACGKNLICGSCSMSNAETVDTGHPESTDRLEETRSYSLCDPDDLSSGSVSAHFDEACLIDKPDARSHLTRNLYIDCSPMKSRLLFSDQNFPCFQPDLNNPILGSLPPQSAFTTNRSQSLCDPNWCPTNRALEHKLVISPEQTESNSTPCWCSHSQNLTGTHELTHRANTLPNAKVLRGTSERKSFDLTAPPYDSHSQLLREKGHNKDPTKIGKQLASYGLDRLLPRFSRKGRRNLRYNTAAVTYNTGDPIPFNRKLSCQLSLGEQSQSVGVDGTRPVTETASFTRLFLLISLSFLQKAIVTVSLVTYCNVSSTQRTGLSTTSTQYQPSLSKLTKPSPTTVLSHLEERDKNVVNGALESTCQSIYVNLPPPLNTTSTNSGHSTCSCGSRSDRKLQHVFHALHHHHSHHHHSQQHPGTGSLSSTNKVVAVQCPDSASLVGTLEPHSQKEHLLSACGKSVLHADCCLNSSANPNFFATIKTESMSLTSDMSSLVPAEVRDPSRNYAMVDLRPSPASSVNTNTELTIGVVHHHHQIRQAQLESITSANSSAGSVVGFSNSASTGSDCTSDAATLTSETLGNNAIVCCSDSNTFTQSGSSALYTCSPTVSQPESTRRRHSHSLSSAVTEVPVLNYVHVIASTAPLSTSASARHDDGSTFSEPIGCSIQEHTDSPSSSSGLGGIASLSITPPLTQASSGLFGDVFTSRSMTSSATSSGEGNPGVADTGFHSYSPPDTNSVAYTQIDFARTLALGEVRGDMDMQDKLASTGSGKLLSTNTTGSTVSQWYSSKVDRSISVRKTFSRPIRSIRRGNHSHNQKKPGSFL